VNVRGIVSAEGMNFFMGAYLMNFRGSIPPGEMN
jgi:hypothetical protein